MDIKRYSMDFTLVFAVRTDNPDPEALTGDDVLAALRERVSDLIAEGPDETISACWPPEIFDHETGVTSKYESKPEVSST